MTYNRVPLLKPDPSIGPGVLVPDEENWEKTPGLGRVEALRVRMSGLPSPPKHRPPTSAETFVDALEPLVHSIERVERHCRPDAPRDIYRVDFQTFPDRSPITKPITLSTILLIRGEDGGLWAQDYMFRLRFDGGASSQREASDAIAGLVGTIGAPAPRTQVFTYETELDDAEQPIWHSHIERGRGSVLIHPLPLLQFLAEFLPTYSDLGEVDYTGEVPESDGVIASQLRDSNAGPPAHPPVTDRLVLGGTHGACSTRKVEGAVRIIDPDNPPESVEGGTILVAPSVDEGCSEVLRSADGVVIEDVDREGQSLAKHQSTQVIAGADGATSVLADGQEFIMKQRGWVLNAIPSLPATDNIGEIRELQGLPASRGKVTAPVRVVDDIAPEATPRNGILVTKRTTPAMVPYLDRRHAPAVIADTGGAASHAAIVAREMGIPAVVGVGNARDELHTGDVVTVDGEMGTVEFSR